jgi:hypothetical protein
MKVAKCLLIRDEMFTLFLQSRDINMNGKHRSIKLCKEKVRLADWYRGYGATTPCAPRPLASRPFARRHLVPSVIPRGALSQATIETSVSEERKRARNFRII